MSHRKFLYLLLFEINEGMTEGSTSDTKNESRDLQEFTKIAREPYGVHRNREMRKDRDILPDLDVKLIPRLS